MCHLSFVWLLDWFTEILPVFLRFESHLMRLSKLDLRFRKRAVWILTTQNWKGIPYDKKRLFFYLLFLWAQKNTLTVRTRARSISVRLQLAYLNDIHNFKASFSKKLWGYICIFPCFESIALVKRLILIGVHSYVFLSIKNVPKVSIPYSCG